MKNPSIHTALTPGQCRERLAAAIDSDSVTNLFGTVGSSRVMGQVDDAGFRLQIRIGYRNSFKTFLWGKFIPDAHGTTVQMRAGLHPFVLAFGYLWMSGAVLGSLGMLAAAWTALRGHGAVAALPPLAFAIAFPMFGVGLTGLGRWLARDEEIELADFVCLHLKSS